MTISEIQRIERLRRLRWVFLILYILATLVVGIWLSGQMGVIVAYYEDQPWLYRPHYWRQVLASEWSLYVPLYFLGLDFWVEAQTSSAVVVLADVFLATGVVALTVFSWRWLLASLSIGSSQSAGTHSLARASLAIPLAAMSTGPVVYAILYSLDAWNRRHGPWRDHEWLVALLLAVAWLTWSAVLIVRKPGYLTAMRVWRWLERVVILGIMVIVSGYLDALVNVGHARPAPKPLPPYVTICLGYAAYWAWGAMLFILFAWPRRKRQWLDSANCPSCGYDLRASKGNCPERGAGIPIVPER